MISSRVSSRQGKSVWRRPPASSSEEPAEAGPTLPSIYKQVLPTERNTGVPPASNGNGAKSSGAAAAATTVATSCRPGGWAGRPDQAQGQAAQRRRRQRIGGVRGGVSGVLVLCSFGRSAARGSRGGGKAVDGDWEAEGACGGEGGGGASAAGSERRGDDGGIG